MIKNYLTVAYRNLLKNKANSLISIFGLAVGLACCILIFFFVRYERGFDRFHKDIDRIYLVPADLRHGDMMMKMDAPPPMGPSLPGLFPEIEAAVRTASEELIFASGENAFKLKGLAVDPGFLEMFDFPLKGGISTAVLNDPGAVILSEAAAMKHFGRGFDPVGLSISVPVNEARREYRIAAVAAPIPKNSSFRFDFLISLAGFYGKRLDDWNGGFASPTFVRLAAGAKPADLVRKFPATIDQNIAGMIGLDKIGPDSGYRLEALAEYHLKGGRKVNTLEGQSSAVYPRILLGIALLILLIACFNFMNLSLGNASTRFKEVGMRKVLGAGRPNLIRQFCLEALTLSLIALLLSVLLARLFLPAFNSFVQRDLRLDLLGPGLPGLVLLGLTALFGLISGLYPAMILSGFDAVALFRRKVRFTGKNTTSRILIVLQFGISIYMIVSTLVMARQNRFLLAKSLGYAAAQTVVVPFSDVSAEAKKSGNFFQVFKQKLLRIPAVRAVGGAEYSLSKYWAASAPARKEGARLIVFQGGVDVGFIPTMGISLAAGRSFSSAFPADATDAVVVNEAFVRQLGLKEPLGLEISSLFSDSQGMKGRIIGVAADFHFQSLRDKIGPVVMKLGASEDLGYAFLKIDGRNIRQTLAEVRAEFLALAPGIPFDYGFLDEDVARQYAAEERWDWIVTSASVFAILIACSGLFGLTLIAVARRTKEIGVRRVLGASTMNVARLINREFLGLVLAANAVGWPAAYWSMKLLLKNYAYRITVSPLLFLFAAGLTAAIAILTISLHAVRASLSNPVETLRYE